MKVIPFPSWITQIFPFSITRNLIQNSLSIKAAEIGIWSWYSEKGDLIVLQIKSGIGLECEDGNTQETSKIDRLAGLFYRDG